MRIFLALSVIIISIQYGSCRIDLKRDKEVIVDIDSPELHQSQYHTADFDTSAYNYGYAVEPNGQFHHETRGGDGVTYGCYGYIDSDDLLKVTHYVADSQGYRTLEHEKPVLVYPINENNVDAYEKPHKPKGVMLDWKDLYFPIGCGMAKGGVLLNAPVIRAPGGNFQQLGETKFPVQPSNEQKVVVPRIPFNVGIKTEPTKLIPVSTAVAHDNKPQNPPSTTSFTFSPSKGSNPSTERTQRPTVEPSISTKFLNNFGGPVSGPEYRQNQPSTEPTLGHTSQPTRFRESSPFKESTKLNGSSTVKAPSEPVKQPKVKSPDSPVGQGQLDYTESLLPPFRTTNLFDTQTTVGLPLNSFDPGNDLNVINSYANFNTESRTTTQAGYVDETTPTTVPIRNQPFSNSHNNNGPTTYSSFKHPGFVSTEIVSTIRPNRFDGFNFNFQTTNETPIDFVTEPNSYSTNPDATTIFSTDGVSVSSSDGGPHTNPPSKDIPNQTSVKFSSTKNEPTGFGVSSSIASKRPVVESYTTPNSILEFETSTPQPTYPGIGDYSKPQSGFEFNIPTRAPNQVSSTGATANPHSFVTNNNGDTVIDGTTPKNPSGVYFVGHREPIQDNVEKTTKFTNGPHGAEYQLGRVPQFTVNNGRDNNFNFLNPIKQSRNDDKIPPVSLITPLTHLSISGSYPSKNNVTTKSTATSQSTQFVTDPSTAKTTSSSTPIYSDSSPGFGSLPQVPYRQNTIQAERESNRPNQLHPTAFVTVTTPRSDPSRGIITHMDAISQTRFQSSRVTPSVTPNNEQTNDLFFSPPANHFVPEVQQNVRTDGIQTSRPEPVKSTEFPFLYTRSRTTSSNVDNIPHEGESNPVSSSPDSITKTPSEELTIFSSFGQRIKPGTNPATTSFTAYYPGSTTGPAGGDGVRTPSTDQRNGNKPASYENLSQLPKFVLRPTARPAVESHRQPLSNFNGYPDADHRNANFYPDSNPQKAIDFGDKNRNNIQPDGKFVNTKKEFVPQYNPNSPPIPGTWGTAIGVYPPNVDELSPEIPNFNIAISKWPFYILPFPFTNGNIMTLPLFNGMPFQLGGNVSPLVNAGTNVNTGSDYAQGTSNVASGGNGIPAQSICSWLSSFIKPKDNATNTETTTNENGETLEISNLQVNIKNPQLQLNQNQNVPFGIVGFIPIIAVPNCQHNVQGDKIVASALPTSIQVPSLCSQLSHLFGTQINAKDTNRPLPT